MPRRRQGFTLIELLIVVVIIGILAAIAIPKFANTKDKAKIASMKTDLRNLMSAQEGHFADWQQYASATSATGPSNATTWSFASRRLPLRSRLYTAMKFQPWPW